MQPPLPVQKGINGQHNNANVLCIPARFTAIPQALKMVDLASEAGADIVKFQTFKAEELVTAKAQKANYQLKFNPKDERISCSSFILAYAGFSKPHTLPTSRNNVLVMSNASKLKSIFVSIDVK